MKTTMMKKQKGFTLIELIIVIIILGILAVTAAPKFLDIQDDARESTIRGVEGSVRAANGIVHSGSLINSAATSLTLEGSTINIVNEYAAARDMCLAIGLTAAGIADGADSTSAATDGQLECVYLDSDGTATGEDEVTIQPVGNTNCGVTYVQPATTAGAVPTITVDATCDA